jgi:hypothetical protein
MTLDFYHKLCSITNETIFQFMQSRDNCVLASAALDETLTFLKIPHRAARLCLAAHHENPKTIGVVLGSEEPGPRRKMEPGRWAGHLGIIAEERFLVDPTADQVNEGRPGLQASPAAVRSSRYLPGREMLILSGRKRLENTVSPCVEAKRMVVSARLVPKRR